MSYPAASSWNDVGLTRICWLSVSTTARTWDVGERVQLALDVLQVVGIAGTLQQLLDHREEIRDRADPWKRIAARKVRRATATIMAAFTTFERDAAATEVLDAAPVVA